MLNIAAGYYTLSRYEGFSATTEVSLEIIREDIDAYTDYLIGKPVP
jgi:hypothetical protein